MTFAMPAVPARYDFRALFRRAMPWLTGLGFVVLAMLLVDTDTHSDNFIRNNIQVFFIGSIFLAAIFLTVRNLNPWRNMRLELLISIWLLVAGFMPMITYANQLNQLVYVVFPIPLAKVILPQGDGSPFFAITVIMLNIIVMTARNALATYREDRVMRSLVNNGLAIYGFLAIVVWIFMHFTYVGSHVFYMSSHFQIVKAMIERSAELGKPLGPVKVFDSDAQLTKYYDEKLGHLSKTKSAELEEKMRVFNGIRHAGFPNEQLTWGAMHDFWDWMQMVFNLDMHGYEGNFYWQMGVVVPKGDDYGDERISHWFLVTLNKDGKIYAYADFNPTFKAKEQNHIYNFLYICAHILFMSAFGYLVYLHRKRFPKVERKKLRLARAAASTPAPSGMAPDAEPHNA